MYGYWNLYPDGNWTPAMSENTEKPKERLVNRDPDCRPSDSEWWTRGPGQSRDIRFYYHVRGVGVLVVRARIRPEDPRGKLDIIATSLVAREEIGYAPGL